jgi:enoyl-CoA hydratase/carnithine racemase
MRPGDTQTWGPVRLQWHDGPLRGAATITLADPDRRNVLGPPMFDGLEASILQLEACTAAARFNPMHEPPPADAVRVVLLQGAGRAFCAGFDLGLLAQDPDPAQPLLALFLKRLAGCTRRLRALPATSVACVQGAALAGGCALAMACDLAVATHDAQLGYPVHAIGLSPAVSGTVLDARAGSGVMRSLFMGGETVDGARAHALGLVQGLVPDTAALTVHAQALACTLLAKGPRALAVTRRWLQTLDQAIDPDRVAAALGASMSTVGSAEGASLLRRVWTERTRS